jgi:hypothetical protein
LKNQETGSETERGRKRETGREFREDGSLSLRELVGSIERGIGELT